MNDEELKNFKETFSGWDDYRETDSVTLQNQITHHQYLLSSTVLVLQKCYWV